MPPDAPADAKPKTKTCRWALLGLSSIAVKFVKDLLLPRDPSSPIRHEIVALSTTGTILRATRWLAEQNVPNAPAIAIHTSYHALLAAETYDIVYISTPQACHYQHTWDALSAARNVLLEKPAVMNEAQYVRLAAHAKAQGVVLMEAMWTRYLPATQRFVADVLPRLGTVKRIFADFSLPIIGDPHLDPASRFLDKSSGAGSIVDLGMYPLTWVDLALHGAGASSVAAASRGGVDVVHANTITHPTPSGDIDDITTAVLTRRDPPCTAIVTTTLSIPGSAVPHHNERLVVAKNAPSIRIQGTRAEAAVAFPPIRPERIIVTHYGAGGVDERGFEVEEVVEAGVYGWGLWYQADVIACAVLERREKGGEEEGLVIGEAETVRVLGWLDRIRDLAGITFGDRLEKPWLEMVSPDDGSRANGVVEEGVVENDVVEKGAVEHGVVENTVVEKGVVEKGVVENGVVEKGMVENGF